MARALRFQGSLPLDFWGECVLTAGYLINRTPSSILKGKTPYEVLHGKPPSYAHLRVFGSLCFARNQNTNGDKFANRSRRCVFVGYPYGQKGWRVYDIETHEFFVSRDVAFFENQFPFQHAEAAPTSSISITEDDEESQLDDSVVRQTESPTEGILVDMEGSDTTNVVVADSTATSNPSNVQSTSSHDESEILGRGCRAKCPSTRLQGFVTNTIQKLSPSTRSPAQSVHRIL